VGKASKYKTSTLRTRERPYGLVRRKRRKSVRKKNSRRGGTSDLSKKYQNSSTGYPEPKTIDFVVPKSGVILRSPNGEGCIWGKIWDTMKFIALLPLGSEEKM